MPAGPSPNSPSGSVPSLADPAVARVMGKALAVMAPGERVTLHARGCHHLHCGVCTCHPIVTDRMGRA